MNTQYKKAVTFSFDDNNVDDLRLLRILNEYNLRCTFNVNTGEECQRIVWPFEGGGKPYEVRKLWLKDHVRDYDGHEIASHTLTHVHPLEVTPERFEQEVLKDLDNIERLFGKRPSGFAYPFGEFNDDTEEVLKHCGIKYARTTIDNETFAMPKNLLRFNPTRQYWREDTEQLADAFLASNTSEPQILCIWGHSYEMGGLDNWERFEALCRKLAGHSDIFYGTCEEIFSRLIV